MWGPAELLREGRESVSQGRGTSEKTHFGSPTGGQDFRKGTWIMPIFPDLVGDNGRAFQKIPMKGTICPCGFIQVEFLGHIYVVLSLHGLFFCSSKMLAHPKEGICYMS